MSNYHTIAPISHATKVMLKVLQPRLQQYMNHELPDVQARFKKGRRTRAQIANIHWIIKKATELWKNIYFCFIDYAKAFDCMDHHKLWKILQEMGIPGHLTFLLRNLYAGYKATFRRLLRVPWTTRRSNQSILKEIQPWDFFGRNDAKAETPVDGPPYAKSWLIGKDSDAGRDCWGQEEKGTTEDEMAGWHHWLDGRESEWTPGVGDGQGGLACCDSWGRKEWTRLSDWCDLI